ncbi:MULTISPECIES: acyl-CoA dehydrogenase family protein [unclassified Mycobacterium]|uniref:acyl-CoA dehydrogenase family protein n=1 Tax=unclassified Mycobacterium TaxID=2642494 RepID=UPI0029C68FD1|nr:MULTISPECIES: acyl-CoA dehydrogenase family protein [unclassified Mycobacterium]
MDFQLGPAAEEFRAEIRAHLDTVMTLELEERVYRTGVSHDAEFAKGLAAKGWLAPEYPEEFGGQQRSAMELQAFHEELMRAEAPIYLIETTKMVAAIIHDIGTPLHQQVLASALRGETTIALGFTEPECGSDVAAAATRAVRAGDDWIINGSKMFTTNGHIADYVFLLARTDPTVAKHKGLTMFLVPLRDHGVEAQGVWTLSGERTNITFYSDVRISDTWRIGEVDRGWQVLLLSLEHEHASGWGQHIARLLDHAQQWASTALDDTATPRLADPDVRRRLARVAMDLEVSTLLERRGVWMGEQGLTATAEGPMSKLFSTEALERAAQDINELVGADALRSYFDPSAPQHGRFEQLMRFSLGTTIYAGTSEIQRSIIAERGLGLPR